MSISAECCVCGRHLSDPALMGLCPQCLLRDAMGGIEAADIRAPGEAALDEAVPRFGDYELLEVMGRGGMGIVYRAREVSLGRMVALKMILSGQFASDAQVRRFHAEAEAAAGLEHPNIVPIHSIGAIEGKHYFSMKLIEGGTLARQIGRFVGEPRSAARLMVKVARAVDHAHRHGILHRDLKPGNILLDEAGEPYVGDFGLARQVGLSGGVTITGQVLGTPNYMAPEQAEGTRQVSVAADVYSLGAIFYEMLTGQPPFSAQTALATLQHVRESEPKRPSTIRRSVDQDLEIICLKCLEKDPQRRYGSAGAVAQDLERWLEGKTILARRVGSAGKLWRWCRRKPVLAALLAATALLLLVVAVGGMAGTVVLQRQNALIAEARNQLVEKLWDAEVAQARASRWSGHPGQRVDALEALARAARIRPTLNLRNEAIAAMALPDLRVAREWTLEPNGEAAMNQALSFDRGLRFWVRSDAGGTLSIRSVADGKEVKRLAGPGEPAWITRFSPGGRYLAAKYHALHNSAANRVRLWDMETGQVILTSTQGIGNECMEFSPDDSRLALGYLDGSIGLHDTSTGREVGRLSSGETSGLSALSFSPSGEKLAVQIWPHTVRILKMPGGEVLQNLRLGASTYRVAWHPRRPLLAVGCGDGQVHVFDTETGREQAPAQAGMVEAIGLAYSRSGDQMVSSWGDQTLRLSHAVGGAALVEVRGAGNVDRPAFSAEDRLMSYALTGSQLRLFEVVHAPECRMLLAEPQPLHALGSGVSISPDGSLLAGAYADGVHVWELDDGEQVALLGQPDVRSVEFSPDGSCLTGCGESGLYRWPISQPAASESSAGRIGAPRKAALPPGGSAAGPWRHSLARDGRTLALTLGEALVVLDVASGREKLRIGRIPGLSGAVISADGRWVVCVNWGGEGTRVIDVASGTNVLSLEHGDSSGAAFSADGRWLAIARTAEYRLWSVGSWEPGLRIEREVVSGAAGEMAFSPDGRILAIAPSCNVVRLVEPASGRELATLEAPGVHMRTASVCFSRDGNLLAAASMGKIIHVWNLRLMRLRLGEMGLDW